MEPISAGKAKAEGSVPRLTDGISWVVDGNLLVAPYSPAEGDRNGLLRSLIHLVWLRFVCVKEEAIVAVDPDAVTGVGTDVLSHASRSVAQIPRRGT